MSALYLWKKYQIEDPDKIPSEPHYVVLVFQNQVIKGASYDPRDPDDIYKVTDVKYYAFNEKDTWSSMIRDIYEQKHMKDCRGEEKTVFFRSNGRVNVSVRLEVEVND